MKTIKLILLFTFIAVASQAQYVTDYKRVADLYFKNKEYFAAAEYYKRALHLTPDSVKLSTPYDYEPKTGVAAKKQGDEQDMMYNLAESYRLYKDFGNAEIWYATAINFKDDKYVLSNLYYAECLRANKKFDAAIASYSKFMEKYHKNDMYMEKAKMEIESCKFALREMRYPKLVDLEKMPAPINAGGSNYAPLKMGNNFYFTSSRPTSSSSKRKTIGIANTSVKKKETPYINAIYTLKNGDKSQKKEIEKVNFNIPETDNAALAVTPDGKNVYFTAWDEKTGDKSYKLYRAAKGMEGKWMVQENGDLQINSKGYNTMQPFVTHDGKYLLFASDRPGGYGKYDLYYASIRTDGTLGQAINLGDAVNTKEDEEAPYFNGKTEKLIFSSNGRIGLGGFDFYESVGDFTDWSDPVNLGFPFNSSKDDIYFTPIDVAGDEGYISSDRESVCCLELLHFKREYITIKGKLTDCESGEPIAGATITLIDSTKKEKVMTDLNGGYMFKRDSPIPVKIYAEKDGYFTKTLSYSYGDLAKADTLMNPNLCLQPLVIDKPITLKDIYYEFNSAELTPSSQEALSILVTLMQDNPKITIELSAHTDNIGSDAYNMDLSQRRAQSCVDFLLSKGINTEKISAKGYGESMPIAPNTINGKDNPEGRQLNRRTEFKVLKK